MQALDLVDCLAEPQLLPILVKVKNILAKRPTRACMESRVSFAKANMVNGRKTGMMLF